MKEYVPLSIHTSYSIGESIVKIKELVIRAKELGLKHLALTDSGNMFAVPEFYRQCIEHKIHPIIGLELPVLSKIDGSEGRSRRPPVPRVILLVKNQKGYKNLIKLCSLVYVFENLAYQLGEDHLLTKKESTHVSTYRFVMEAILFEHCEGLICIHPLDSIVSNYYFGYWDKEKAYKDASQYKAVFSKDDLFIGMGQLEMSGMARTNRELYSISRQLNIPLAAFIDVRYLHRSDVEALHLLGCIKNGRKKDNFVSFHTQVDQFWLKSYEEMESLYRKYPEPLLNTVKIAERCTFSLEPAVPYIPEYTLPSGHSDRNAYLTDIVVTRLKEMNSFSESVSLRLDYELNIIKENGLPSFFLLWWDIIDFTRLHNIPTGTGRGSIGGSLVAYALGLTDINPMDYGLHFETFYNPDQERIPQIQFEICEKRRAEVVDYIFNKYGYRRAGIVSYSPHVTKNHIITSLFTIYSDSQEKENIIEAGKALTELVHNIEPHPASIAIGKTDLFDYVPLYHDPESGKMITQYSSQDTQDHGLMTLCLLGSRVLTEMHEIEEEIQQNDKTFSIKKIPLDDPRTFELFKHGDTVDIFQFTSPGIREVLHVAQPQTLQELSIINALYRPPINPLNTYLKVKSGSISPSYEFPVFEKILQDTLGVVVYKEQVNRMIQKVTGLSMIQADSLRRGLNKRIDSETRLARSRLIREIHRNCYSENEEQEITEWIVPKCNAFSQAHSLAYSLLSYRCAYLKAHYPEVFIKYIKEDLYE